MTSSSSKKTPATPAEYITSLGRIKGEYRAGNAAILGLSITVAVAATWHGRRE